MSDSIQIQDIGSVRQITLNRPKAFNSFDREMGRAFQQALDTAAEDDNVRCIVITGEGRAFCAGQDLKEVTAPSISVHECSCYLKHRPSHLKRKDCDP